MQFVPSTRTFLNLPTLSLYTSSGTEEFWKEVAKEEVEGSCTGAATTSNDVEVSKRI